MFYTKLNLLSRNIPTTSANKRLIKYYPSVRPNVYALTVKGQLQISAEKALLYLAHSKGPAILPVELNQAKKSKYSIIGLAYCSPESGVSFCRNQVSYVDVEDLYLLTHLINNGREVFALKGLIAYLVCLKY
jgi:hypothetical protein